MPSRKKGELSEKIPLLNKDWNSFKLALEFYSCLLKQMTETTLKYNENNENKKIHSSKLVTLSCLILSYR